MIQRIQGGFTLVETALVLLVLGLFISSAVPFLEVNDDSAAYRLTHERQAKIAVALSDYVDKKGYLPCSGAPDAATLGVPRSSCNTVAQRDGIVPFQEIGVSQLDATDGHGNPFTYAISNAIRNGQVTSANVERKCRALFPVLPVWIFLDGLFTYLNLSSSKARVCCQQVPDSDAIAVRNSAAGSSVTPTQGSAGASGVFALPIIPSLLPSSAGTLSYLSYTVISHGRNGRGAYVFGSAVRHDASGASADELENTDMDGVYVSRSPDLGAGSAFDDIVIWRTQEQMIAETGVATCDAP